MFRKVSQGKWPLLQISVICDFCTRKAEDPDFDYRASVINTLVSLKHYSSRVAEETRGGETRYRFLFFGELTEASPCLIISPGSLFYQ